MIRLVQFARLFMFSLFLLGTILLGEHRMEAEAAETKKFLVLETSKGEVVIRLRPELAPNHVARVSELAEFGFYDGIVFHRVIPGFMAQTGDPTGTGTGGSGQLLEEEFTNSPFLYGSVGMARSQNPNSADSQFFLCFDGCGHLTGQYTLWGQVESGMEAIEKIAPGSPPTKMDSIVRAYLRD